tara:strand:- start:548 stop:1027 length:480 start_codon:yes stop_codon:yes gene_type:complete
MCIEDFKILRVSNRGQNVYQSVANQTYRVNIPSELRLPNKRIKVEVISGTMTFTTDSTFDSYSQIGVISNLPNGYDTESDSSFNSKNYELLFNIDTSGFDKSASKLMTFHNSNNFQFMINNIPEKLEFTSVSTTGAGVLSPIVNNNYISFVLKFTYYDN